MDLIWDLVNHILEIEIDNYYEWCEENNFDPIDYKDNTGHVYAKAMLIYFEREIKK